MDKEKGKNALVVVAIGGNSLIIDKQHQRVEDQYKAVCETVAYIVDLMNMGYNIVVTHGNGPQVGFIMRRSEMLKRSNISIQCLWSAAMQIHRALSAIRFSRPCTMSSSNGDLTNMPSR